MNSPTPESAALPAASPPETQLDALFGQENLSILPAGKALDFVWDHRGWLAGPAIGLVLALTQSPDSALAADGVLNQSADEGITRGVEIAVGIAAAAGLLSGLGNGIRTYHSEKNAIAKLDDSYDKMVEMINGYAKATPQDFQEAYAQECMSNGEQPTREGMSEYVREKMANQGADVTKMIGELSELKEAIGKRKFQMLVNIPYETFQAFFGVSGMVIVGFYVFFRGAIQDAIITDNPFLKAGLAVGVAGATLQIVSMLKEIAALEGPGGAAEARIKASVQNLQKVGFLKKPEKKQRPKLEVGVSPKQAGDNGKNKRRFRVKA